MQISYFLIKARNKKNKKTTTQFLQHCMWKNDSFTTHDFIYIIEIICMHFFIFQQQIACFALFE